MTPSKFKSLQPLALRARKREKESKKEKEKALKHVLNSLFLTPRLSSNLSTFGWQWCKNISSLQPAPSSQLPPASSLQ
jgi:hypothetical protein